MSLQNNKKIEIFYLFEITNTDCYFLVFLFLIKYFLVFLFLNKNEYLKLVTVIIFFQKKL